MEKIIRYSFILFLIMLSACSDQDNNKIIEESGIIEANEIIVSSQVMGQIDKIIFEEGSKIKKGDTLLIINSKTYDLKKEQSLAGLEMAKAKYDMALKGARKEDLNQAELLLKQTETLYNQAERDKIRYTNLFENKTISKKQYEDVLVKYDVAKIQYLSSKENFNKMKNFIRVEELSQIKANYNQAFATVQSIEDNINNCFIVSPLNGFITKQFVEKGELVNLFSNLFKITDLSKIEVIVYVSELEIGKVKLGQKVEVRIDSYPDKIYAGLVKYISTESEFTPKNIQTKDERTKLVFKVKISVENHDYELKPGIPADIKINVN